MNEKPPGSANTMTEESPETLLDAFRAHPEWTQRERDEQFDRLIAAIPGEQLSALLRARLGELSGTQGEALLRLVEAQATPEVLRDLAESLLLQPDLAPERTWEALALLEGAGLLDDYPQLAELWNELEESLDEDASIVQLAEQLEEDPDGPCLALQGMGAIEPEVRPQIIEGLANVSLGPGVIAFLRLLGFAHDPMTRTAALDALARPEPGNLDLVRAWSALADDHPDAEVVARARRWLEGVPERSDTAITTTVGAAPRLVRSLVTALDGQGRGSIVIASERGDARVTAAFLCDLRRGVPEVLGKVDRDAFSGDQTFREFAEQSDLEVIEDSAELALRLLGGSVLLCGPETSPELRYWLEEAVHPGFRPLPFPAPFPGWDPETLPFDEMPVRAGAVLEACPGWIDASPLTYDIAEEIALRERSGPDPRRDAGAYRYLFEHQLIDQVEFYRRMLYWMATFWQASGQEDLGRSALALASQLSDPTHAVPGHPFTVALITRSLAAAQADLRNGIDPRRTPLQSKE